MIFLLYLNDTENEWSVVPETKYLELVIFDFASKI